MGSPPKTAARETNLTPSEACLIYPVIGRELGFLYMLAYFWQENEIDNVNYPSEEFPTDKWLIKRPFMWVNIFWLVMPFYTIAYYIFENWAANKKNNYSILEKKKLDI